MSREQPQWVEVRVPCPHGEESHWLDVSGTVIRTACVGKKQRFESGDVRGVLDLMGSEPEGYEWCAEHRSVSMKEPGDEDGFDCQAAHGFNALQPCRIIPAIVVRVEGSDHE